MKRILKTILCTYCIISLCYATPPSCLELHQSQLNTLNERMNQMLSALYSSPILSKLKTVTSPESNPENTSTAEETPEAVYDTSAYYAPTSAGVTPQVVYLPSSNTPSSELGSTRTARSYYQPDVPFEYLMSPWSQYYDPYRSALSLGYPPTLLQNPLASLYDPYREFYSPASYPPYLPSAYPAAPPVPPAYPSAPAPTAYPTLPSTTYPTPQPTYQTPPPIYQTPPPIYQTPPAYKTLPQTYQAPPPYRSPSPALPSPPPPYQTPLASYQTPPPTHPTLSPSYPIPSTYQTPPPAYNTPPPAYNTPPPAYNTPPPAYNTPPPAYNTPPPVYSPSPISPYSPVRYSRAVEYSPYYPQTPI